MLKMEHVQINFVFFFHTVAYIYNRNIRDLLLCNNNK